MSRPFDKDGRFIPSKRVMAIPPWPINTGARSSNPKGVAWVEFFRFKCFGFALKLYRVKNRIDLKEYKV